MISKSQEGWIRQKFEVHSLWKRTSSAYATVVRKYSVDLRHSSDLAITVFYVITLSLRNLKKYVYSSYYIKHILRRDRFYPGVLEKSLQELSWNQDMLIEPKDGSGYDQQLTLNLDSTSSTARE